MRRFLAWLFQKAGTQGPNSPAVNYQGSGNVEISYGVSIESIRRAHSLDDMRASGSPNLGVSIQKLTDEAENSDIRTNPALKHQTLIVGPPYVGKTCWAIRRAWRAHLDLKPCIVFYFHAKEESDLLNTLNSNSDPNMNYIIIIDDIHLRQDNFDYWLDPLTRFRERRPSRVRVVWVARDESIFGSLGLTTEQIEPFPMEQIVDLFLNQTSLASLDQRVIAALEAGLDPELGREMARGEWSKHGSYGELVSAIHTTIERHVLVEFEKVEQRLGPKSFDGYKGLLPFSGIAFPVESKFLADMSDIDTTGIQALLNSGYCTIRSGKLQLTEHPFQLRRKLHHLDELETEQKTAQRFSWPEDLSAARKISEAALGRYVQSANDRVATLGTLNQHAEWAGVLDPLAAAARHLVKVTKDDVLREEALRVSLKLSRTASPGDEMVEQTAYVNGLKEALAWWTSQQNHAEASDMEFHAGNRLDYILYEVAYIYYLLEDYEAAALIFGRSVDAGIRAIERALNDQEGSPFSTRQAQFALSNIWIAGLLEKGAILRGHLKDTIESGRPVHSELINMNVEGISRTYHALTAAWMAGPEGLATGVPYLNAVRDALRPGHQFSDCGLGINLQDKRYQDFLMRHRFNAYIHSIETPSWSWLFGVTRDRINVPSGVMPIIDWREIVPLGDRNSRTDFRHQQARVLFNATETGKKDDIKPLHLAAMLRAAGSFEYLGDTLLLAWRTAVEPAEKDAISWFLANRVPDVGFNKLPKLALSNLVARLPM